MINLLIVDDEEEIRKGIRLNVDWEAYGVSICGEAEDGEAALKLIKETHPDILLIDIRMPGLSGLQVIEAINSKATPIKSIILSGHDDFNYAQSALRYGVSDYLLKPCRSRDILEVVLKVKSSIEAEQNSNEVLQRFKIQFNESFPLLKERFLCRMINVDEKNSDIFVKNFDMLKINLENMMFAVVLIRINDYFEISEHRRYEDIELLKFAIKNITFDTIRPYYKCEVFESNNDVVVIMNSENNSSDKFLDVFNTLKANISKFLNVTTSIGVGNCYKEPKDIRQSYLDAFIALESCFYLGNDIIIKYNDNQELHNEKAFYPLNAEREIINNLNEGKPEVLKENLEAYISKLQIGTLSQEYVKKLCLSLVLSLNHLCIENNIPTDSIFGTDLSYIDTILKFDTLERIKDSLLEKIKLIAETVISKKSGNKIIEHALNFINENFNKEITLEALASEVYLNPKYLSMLFKKVVGCNFVDYIQNLRISKACELLKDVRLKAYDVAYSVGYSDEKYFSQIFKKLKGVTPSQYRKPE
ncbi:MAG TPA: response regulator [Ruminiclostridium sp.]